MPATLIIGRWSLAHIFNHLSFRSISYDCFHQTCTPGTTIPKPIEGSHGDTSPRDCGDTGDDPPSPAFTGLASRTRHLSLFPWSGPWFFARSASTFLRASGWGHARTVGPCCKTAGCDTTKLTPEGPRLLAGVPKKMAVNPFLRNYLFHAHSS